VAQRWATASTRGARPRGVLIAAIVVGFVAIVTPAAAAADTVSAPSTAIAAAAHPQSLPGIVRIGVDDFDSDDADFFLDRDNEGRSTLRTVETFVAVFPADQNRGMRRAIPDYYQGAPADVSNISVTDETGEPRACEVENDGGFTLVTSASDSFVSSPQIYVFSYEQSDVTRFGSERHCHLRL